jgi:UDP-glucose 6-dehydrogenase
MFNYIDEEINLPAEVNTMVSTMSSNQNDLFQKKINIGFIGFGVVNQSIYKNLKDSYKKEKYIYSLETRYYDNLDNILETDMVVITINTDYFPDKRNKKNIETNKNNFKKFGSKKSLFGLVNQLLFLYDNDYQGTVIIKSTVLPELLNKYLKKKDMNLFDTDLNIIFWPEFLNANTAEMDFKFEKPLFGGDPILIENLVDLLNTVLKNKIHVYDTGTFNEVMEFKYFRNMVLMNHFVFLNTIPELFKTDIRKFDLFLNNHPYEFNKLRIAADGRLGVGGACLPKDLDNFIQGYYNLQNKKYIEESNDLNAITHLENISLYNKSIRN